MWSVDQNRVTRANSNDVQEFIRLDRANARGELKKNGKKKLIRLRIRLQKEGVISPLSRESLRAHAREMFESWPWWRRWSLKLKFRFVRALARGSALIGRLKSK